MNEWDSVATQIHMALIEMLAQIAPKMATNEAVAAIKDFMSADEANVFVDRIIKWREKKLP